MEFSELAKARFSCRKYANRLVEKEMLEKVLLVARTAPSAKNLQPWKFFVIQNTELLDQIKSCYKREWIKHTNTIIVAVGNHNEAWRRRDGKSSIDIDLSIAIDHITLAATEIGLATCWIGMFDAQKCSEILELKEGEEAIALLPIGYPEQETLLDRHDRLRKSLDEIVVWK